MDKEVTKYIYETLIAYFGSQKVLAERLGIMPTSLNNRIKRHTFNSVEAIQHLPEFSTEWLLHGTGPMLDCDAADQEEQALAVLGITREQLAAIKSAPVPSASPEAEQNNVRTYETAHESFPMHLNDGDPVDRALLNLLLREKAALEAKLATKDQELEVLRTRNLDLEKQNAVMSDRLQNAEAWYRQNIQKKAEQ